MDHPKKIFRIPKVRLYILLNHLNDIYQAMDDRRFSNVDFAKTLQLRPNSSGIELKIQEMRRFGLLEGSIKSLHITELGKGVLQSDIPQRQAALVNTILNIKLWRLFWESGGKDISDQEILNVLTEYVGLTERDAKSQLQDIKDQYLKDIDCIDQFNPRDEPVRPSKSVSNVPEVMEIPQDLQPVEKNVPLNEQKPKAIQAMPMEKPKEKMTMSIRYGTHEYQIEDELTYNIAEQVMKAVKKELIKQGVRFDPVM